MAEEKETWYFILGERCGKKYKGKYMVITGTYAGAVEKMVNKFGFRWDCAYSEHIWNRKNKAIGLEEIKIKGIK